MTDPIDTALLPCPFCGGAAALQPIQGNNPRPFAWDVIHSCVGKGKDGFIRIGPRDAEFRSTKEMAIAAWNTRAASQADTARAEGIALGLAMAKAAPTYDRNFDTMERVDYGAWISVDDIPEPPIPPHVAAARVLLDDLRLARDKADTDEGARAITRWLAAEDAFEPHRQLLFKGLAAALLEAWRAMGEPDVDMSKPERRE